MSWNPKPNEAVPSTGTATESELDRIWRVIVLNDPVNLMSYVVMVFCKVFGYSMEKSRKHMLEVHEDGRSCLWIGTREQAEAYTHTLQEWQLTAQLESDD